MSFRKTALNKKYLLHCAPEVTVRMPAGAGYPAYTGPLGHIVDESILEGMIARGSNLVGRLPLNTQEVDLQENAGDDLPLNAPEERAAEPNEADSEPEDTGAQGEEEAPPAGEPGKKKRKNN